MLDSAVDVVMGLLPKIHIDNLEGQTHDFAYSVGNIDLGGFKVGFQFSAVGGGARLTYTSA